MAEVVAGFPRRGPKVAGKYAKYMDGQVWALRRGEDYKCSDVSARCYIHHVAGRSGKLAKTSIVDGVLYVQVVKR
jgi:hypothetical protein